MKKLLKGFTLVELIVVMAVFSILMTAIIQFFKPIRETYVDSTLFESQRTAQNGVIKYISESVRYATDLGVYTSSGSGNVSSAVEDFTKAYLASHNIASGSAEEGKARTYIAKNAEVIIIDSALPYQYGGDGKDYYGRILRRKVNGVKAIASTDDTVASGWSRLALGAPYYGRSDYCITIEPEEELNPANGKRAKASLKLNVASKASYGQRELEKGKDPFEKTDKVVSVSGLVLCQNLSLKNATFDFSKYNESVAHTKGKSKTYIVYLNDNTEVTK